MSEEIPVPQPKSQLTVTIVFRREGNEVRQSFQCTGFRTLPTGDLVLKNAQVDASPTSLRVVGKLRVSPDQWNKIEISKKDQSQI